jgi:cardiolipin synthase
MSKVVNHSSLQFSAGNSIKIILNGPDSYSAMLAAIAKAKDRIYFANYCFQQGVAFDRFFELLAAKAKEGVEVRVLADEYGSSRTDPSQIASLRLAGVDWQWFNPWQTGRFWRYNHRLHKKLLIIDDATAFTGGVGVADFWLQPTPEYKHFWRDTHFQIAGPIVGDMQASFVRSWNQDERHLLSAARGRDRGKHGGSTPMAPVDSHPRGGLTAVGEFYLTMIQSAQSTLTITTAYFGPDQTIRRALIAAAKRGVAVRLLVNGPFATHKVALEAGRHHYQPLLAAGVHIYEYQPTKIHAKLVVADGKISSIGSGNLNSRSLHLDEEFNIAVDDPKFAGQLEAQFEKDLEHARQVKPAAWRQRPLDRKLEQAASSLGRHFF